MENSISKSCLLIEVKKEVIDSNSALTNRCCFLEVGPVEIGKCTSILI